MEEARGLLMIGIVCLLCFSGFAGGADDAVKRGAIISAFQAKYMQWAQTPGDRFTVTPFFKDIARVAVQKERDGDRPVETIVYYATSDMRFYQTFLGALRTLKYDPHNEADARALALILIRDSDPDGTIIKDRAEVKKVPRKLVRAYDVSEPAVTKKPEYGSYDLVIFSYKPEIQAGYKQARQPEMLMRHHISVENGKYSVDSQDLLAGGDNHNQ